MESEYTLQMFTVAFRAPQQKETCLSGASNLVGVLIKLCTIHCDSQLSHICQEAKLTLWGRKGCLMHWQGEKEQRHGTEEGSQAGRGSAAVRSTTQAVRVALELRTEGLGCLYSEDDHRPGDLWEGGGDGSHNNNQSWNILFNLKKPFIFFLNLLNLHDNPIK